MITIFNRKELLCTYDIQLQSDVRTILQQNNIDYSIRTVDRTSSSPFGAGSRARSGTFCENRSLELEYIIYVKREEYDGACGLIGNRRR